MGERKGLKGTGLDSAVSGSNSGAPSGWERRYPVALALYGVLAALVWFTMGEGKVLFGGRLVEMRLVPLVIIGGLALRTVLARHAEKIRRGGDQGGSTTPGSL